MTKADLEATVFDINTKLDTGIKVNVQIKDYRKSDAFVHGLIIGLTFAVGSLTVQGIKNRHTKNKNQKWYSEMIKKTES